MELETREYDKEERKMAKLQSGSFVKIVIMQKNVSVGCKNDGVHLLICQCIAQLTVCCHPQSLLKFDNLPILTRYFAASFIELF